MSTVIYTGPASLNLADALAKDGTVISSSTTQFVQDYGDGTSLTVTGNFTSFDPDGSPSAGTITGVVYTNGASSLTITTSLDVGQVSTLLDNGNIQGVLALLLAGADTVTGNFANNQIATLGGADTITTGGGLDLIDAGSGNDTIIASAFFAQGTVFNGGDGTDTLRLLPGAMLPPHVLGTTIPLALGFNATISNIERLHLSSQAGQTLDVLFTLDQVNSFATMIGGAGTDAVIATMTNGGGTFSLNTFTLQNWGAEDKIGISVGNATGNFTLNASAHTAGIQFLGGGAGNDTLNGSSGRDELFGRGGTNTIFGFGGDDRIFTGRGVDTIDAGAGNDQVDIEDDVLIGSNYQGGTGTDLLQINQSAVTTIPAGDFFLGMQATFSGFEVMEFDTDEGMRLTALFRHDQMTDVTTMLGGDGYRTVLLLLPNGGGAFTLKNFRLVDWKSYNPVTLEQGDIIGMTVGNATGDFTLSAATHTHTYLLAGGAGNDRLTGTNGIEILNGNGGDDIIQARGGDDIINGGDGIDTLTYADAASGVTVKLDVTLQQNTGGGGRETISNMENLIGSAHADILFGNAGANRIEGRVGADKLQGGAGKDALFGGVDTDVDTFIYTAITDSAVGAGRDQVFDFVSGTDKIDLRQIDANTALANNQLFAFSTTGAAANAIWIVDPGTSLIVRGDVNGDAVADFEIQLMNTPTAVATDFFL